MEPNDAGDVLARDLFGFEMDFERGGFIVQGGETAAEVVAIGRDDELGGRTILLHARQGEGVVGVPTCRAEWCEIPGPRSRL